MSGVTKPVTDEQIAAVLRNNGGVVSWAAGPLGYSVTGLWARIRRTPSLFDLSNRGPGRQRKRVSDEALSKALDAAGSVKGAANMLGVSPMAVTVRLMTPGVRESGLRVLDRRASDKQRRQEVSQREHDERVRKAVQRMEMVDALVLEFRVARADWIRRCIEAGLSQVEIAKGLGTVRQRVEQIELEMGIRRGPRGDVVPATFNKPARAEVTNETT